MVLPQRPSAACDCSKAVHPRLSARAAFGTTAAARRVSRREGTKTREGRTDRRALVPTKRTTLMHSRRLGGSTARTMGPSHVYSLRRTKAVRSSLVSCTLRVALADSDRRLPLSKCELGEAQELSASLRERVASWASVANAQVDLVWSGVGASERVSGDAKSQFATHAANRDRRRPAVYIECVRERMVHIERMQRTGAQEIGFSANGSEPLHAALERRVVPSRHGALDALCCVVCDRVAV